jgi:hypothetical protein
LGRPSSPASSARGSGEPDPEVHAGRTYPVGLAGAREHVPGQWLGIRPTEKVITMTGVTVDRVVDGLIVEHGGAADVFGPFLEAGAIRVVGPGDAAGDG